MIGKIAAAGQDAAGEGMERAAVGGREADPSWRTRDLPPTPAYRLAAAETVRIRLLPTTLRSRYSTATHDLVQAEALVAGRRPAQNGRLARRGEGGGERGALYGQRRAGVAQRAERRVSTE